MVVQCPKLSVNATFNSSPKTGCRKNITLLWKQMLLHIKFKTDFLKKMFVLSFGAITTSQLRFSPNNHGDRLEIKKTRFHASFCYFRLTFCRKPQILIWSSISLFCFVKVWKITFYKRV